MKREIALRWAAALRSGRYRQTLGTLRDPTGAMCCLGVLCDLYSPTGWTGVQTYSDQWSVLPTEVMQWAGLRTSSGLLEPITVTSDALTDPVPDLTHLNDHEGFSFDEIADYIEMVSDDL